MAMHISKTSAKTIVNEISKLVKQNINLMNEQGIIIASCDKERIGQFHEGAYKIITEKLDEYYISEEKATETARKGLNLPLELDGEIVGVVGITGSYDEVINQGRLLKKMTEILLTGIPEVLSSVNGQTNQKCIYGGMADPDRVCQ